MEQKFPVALSSRNRARHELRAKSDFLQCPRDLLAGSQVHARVAYDAAFSNTAASCFKLWLDENDPVSARREHGREGRKQERHGYEAYIAGDNLNPFSDLIEGQITRVDALMEDDTAVGAQLPIDLSSARIYRMNAQSAALQKAIGKPASRRAHIQTNTSRDRNFEVFERRFEFQAPAADVTQRLLHRDHIYSRHQVPGLIRSLPAHRYFASKYKSLCLRARFD